MFDVMLILTSIMFNNIIIIHTIIINFGSSLFPGNFCACVCIVHVVGSWLFFVPSNYHNDNWTGIIKEFLFNQFL